MNKLLIIVSLITLLVAAGCGGKKDKEAGATPEEEYTFKLGTCPVSSIRVSPPSVHNSECTTQSDCAVTFQATAYDQAGRPVSAPLHWMFRYSDEESEQLAGDGHRLDAINDSQAVFRASGMARGTFSVIAQDRSCNLGTEKEPQYVQGEARVKVYDQPGAEVSCGRMRVTYGDRLDRVGDEVIAAAKVLLIAEVSAGKKLGYRYKVLFYVNGKPYPTKRPLYFDNDVALAPEMSTGHVALLPMYLTPGEYEVRYELLEKGEPVCGSRVERFYAR